jgi:hypothetical protein
MVCHMALLKSVKRANTINIRMGVSKTIANVEGIKGPKREKIISLQCWTAKVNQKI